MAYKKLKTAIYSYLNDNKEDILSGKNHLILTSSASETVNNYSDVTFSIKGFPLHISQIRYKSKSDFEYQTEKVRKLIGKLAKECADSIPELREFYNKK